MSKEYCQPTLETGDKVEEGHSIASVLKVAKHVLPAIRQAGQGNAFIVVLIKTSTSKVNLFT